MSNQPKLDDLRQPKMLPYSEAVAKAESEHKFHPLCLVFPIMAAVELAALAEDIKANGLEKVIVLLDGQILDGRNRLVACFMAGVQPQFVDWSGNGSPLDWVLSVNLHRRHLTSLQRATLAYQLLPEYEVQAKERQRLSPGRGEKVAKSFATVQGKASDLAAKALQTNATYVEFVKKLAGLAPDLLESIRSGSLDYRSAKTLLPLSAERRQALLLECNGQPAALEKVIDGLELIAVKAPELNDYIASGKFKVALAKSIANLPPKRRAKLLKESQGESQRAKQLLVEAIAQSRPAKHKPTKPKPSGKASEIDEEPIALADDMPFVDLEGISVDDLGEEALEPDVSKEDQEEAAALTVEQTKIVVECVAKLGGWERAMAIIEDCYRAWQKNQ